MMNKLITDEEFDDSYLRERIKLMPSYDSMGETFTLLKKHSKKIHLLEHNNIEYQELKIGLDGYDLPVDE